MKYLSIAILFVLVSCGNKKEISLPKSNITIVGNVEDHSPIYIFFRIKGKDTLAEVNRKNSISTTNWILNIDKRLPLRLVIPEVMKLQIKKRNSAHKSEDAENYYSYADSIGKNMAFLSFTKVYYVMEKPKKPKMIVVVSFDKNNEIKVNNVFVKKEGLQNYLENLPNVKSNKFLFCFDKNLSFGNYIQDKVFIQSLEFTIPNLNLTNQEFIY